MREIKFRVFARGQLYTIEGDKTLMMSDTGNTIAFWCSDGIFDELPVDELMQYTGLKDKHGTEIYEGDIVRVKSRLDAAVGPVVYNSTKFGFNVPVTSEFEERFRALNEGWYGVEVIGNIHENPELLES